MSLVHINRPRGHYVGQIRPYGGRRWITVTGNCKSDRAALSLAVRRLTGDIKRARALFIDASGWYEPHICMEASR